MPIWSRRRFCGRPKTLFWVAWAWGASGTPSEPGLSEFPCCPASGGIERPFEGAALVRPFACPSATVVVARRHIIPIHPVRTTRFNELSSVSSGQDRAGGDRAQYLGILE